MAEKEEQPRQADRCPKCGYERRPSDDKFTSATECPICKNDLDRTDFVWFIPAVILPVPAALIGLSGGIAFGMSAIFFLLGFGKITFKLIKIHKVQKKQEHIRWSALSPEEQANEKHEAQKQANLKVTEQAYGNINPKMVCPHCQEKGCIRTKAVDKSKAGLNPAGFVAGEMVAGAVGGLLGGMTRFERKTQAYCENCKNTWVF